MRSIIRTNLHAVRAAGALGAIGRGPGSACRTGSTGLLGAVDRSEQDTMAQGLIGFLLGAPVGGLVDRVTKCLLPLEVEVPILVARTLRGRSSGGQDMNDAPVELGQISGCIVAVRHDHRGCGDAELERAVREVPQSHMGVV